MGGQLYFPEKTDRATNTNITTSENVEEEDEELCVAHDTEICVDDDVELRLPDCQILRASTKKLSQPATRKDRDKMIQILKILY